MVFHKVFLPAVFLIATLVQCNTVIKTDVLEKLENFSNRLLQKMARTSTPEEMINVYERAIRDGMRQLVVMGVRDSKINELLKEHKLIDDSFKYVKPGSEKYQRHFENLHLLDTECYSAYLHQWLHDIMEKNETERLVIEALKKLDQIHQLYDRVMAERC